MLGNSYLVLDYKGSVWIELIFTETENWNWKHCSKINFKCINNVMGPIFNKKVIENCNLWDPWTVHGYTVHSWQVNYYGLKKKKKKRLQNTNAILSWIQTRTRIEKRWFWLMAMVLIEWQMLINYGPRVRKKDIIYLEYFSHSLT